MRRRSGGGGGKRAKTRRRKTPAPRGRSESKLPRRRKAAAAARQSETARLRRELAEALERQTAISEVNQVISRTGGDLRSVLEAVAENSARLCGADRAFVFRFDGELLRSAAAYNATPEFAAWVEKHPIRPGRHSGAARAALERRTVHIPDVRADPEYSYGAREVEVIRTILGVPVLKGAELLGVLMIFRLEVRPFTDQQIALVETFADQAAIAIENARLLDETREALEQQTATAEVLQVINSSPGDLGPVFDAMLEKAMRLCDAAFGGLGAWQGDRVRFVAARGPQPLNEYVAGKEVSLGSREGFARVARGRGFVQFADISKSAFYASGEPFTRFLVDACGARTTLSVPLARDDTVMGVLAFFRQEVKPFSGKEIALVRNFAAQAVIAMENARLINETREALEQQTATAEVLQVINSSPGDLAPVFEAMLEKALHLCEAAIGTLWTFDGERFHMAANRGMPAAIAELLRDPIRPHPEIGLGRILRGESTVINLDMAAEPAYRAGDPVRRAMVEVGHTRSGVQVALRKDGELLGAIMIYRNEVRQFSEKQVALLQNFAAQAVIAMENARLMNETREALEQQTATAEVLQVINASPGDLAPVFEAMLEKATRICSADAGILATYDGECFVPAALRGFGEFPLTRIDPHPDTGIGRVVRGEDIVHILDSASGDVYRSGNPARRAIVELGGARSQLTAALRKEGKLLGSFTLWRREVRPFSDKQIALLQSFAAQAVIAIENARLLSELRSRTSDLARSVDELTATGDVLKIISRSTVDLDTVLDTLVETVSRLCRVDQAQMYRRRDDKYHLVASCGLSGEAEEFFRTHPLAHDRGTMGGRVGLGRRVVHIHDALQDPEYTFLEGQKLARFRTMLGIPLLREETLIGIFILNRTRVEPFTDKEIELAVSFADQAVIAIENARLLSELRSRTSDLARSVEDLTATSDVLKIISRSAVDLETVLDRLTETAARLCRADHAWMFRRRDELLHLVTVYGASEEAEKFVRAHPFALDRGTTTGRVALERRAIHIPDLASDPEYTYGEGAKIGDFRTVLGIPLLREGVLLGVFTVTRSRVDPFTEREIELATTFADQAVIAIENARLFEELRGRQAELRVTFDNMGDGVVMFDQELRMAAWNRNFQQILDLPDAVLAARPSYADYIRLLAERGEFGTENVEAELARRLQDTEREYRAERVRPDGRIIEVRRNVVPGGGFVLIYSDVTERKRSEQEVRAARDAAEAALRELKAAQTSLIHAEKMASLGQLTAGIAHEIKNPLNFVNNFAALSVELLNEFKEEAEPALAALNGEKRAGIEETVALLTGNLQKIAEHGRRADGIVKSMLLHSRGGSGERQRVDLNALIEEALNLAYHGARAQDQTFNVTLERDLAPGIAPIELVPQDMTRVFLNLIGNGFYAAHKRSRETGKGPFLKVSTRDLGAFVEVRIRDNGAGIAPENRDKLFQPFFTTKPTGEGTGLGLSISYEIVKQQHGGTIEVESEVGSFAEFIVRLPRHRPALAEGGVA